jgi:hypothetical protein
MKKSTPVRQKKIGRPATGTAPLIALRIPEDFIAEIDRWAKSKKLNRSAAIRRLIEAGAERMGVAVKGKRS